MSTQKLDDVQRERIAYFFKERSKPSHNDYRNMRDNSCLEIQPENFEVSVIDELQLLRQEIASLKSMFENNKTNDKSEANLLNLSQAATYTGYSKSALYKWTSSGEISFYKPNGKTIFFSHRDLDSFLFRKRIRSTQDLQTEAGNQLIKIKHK